MDAKRAPHTTEAGKSSCPERLRAWATGVVSQPTDSSSPAPWLSAAAEVARTAVNWYEQYHEQVCGEQLDGTAVGRAPRPGATAVPADDRLVETRHQPWLAALWTCWRYHWQQVADWSGGYRQGVAVGEHLRAGRDAAGERELGVDPLRDVVLAHACLAQHNRALELFSREFAELCVQLARGVAPRRAADDEFWPELLEALIGLSGARGKLTNFQGRCGLRYWLRTVVCRFALGQRGESVAAEVRRDQRNWLRRKRLIREDALPDAALHDAAHLANLPQHEDSTDRWTMLGDQLAQRRQMQRWLRLLVRVVFRSLAPMHHRKRLVLQLRLLDQLPNEQVAAIVGVSPGQASRVYLAAVEEFRQAVLDGRHVEPDEKADFEEACSLYLHGPRRPVLVRCLKRLIANAAENVHDAVPAASRRESLTEGTQP